MTTVFLFSGNQSSAMGLTYSKTPPLVSLSHTSHTPMELKPIPHFDNGNLKFASVRPIVNTAKQSLNDFDGKNVLISSGDELCKKNGYTLTKCSGNQVPSDICPSDPSYFKLCCGLEFTNSCSYPYVQGEQCGNLYKCECAEEFKYNAQNCKSPHVLSGSKCSISLNDNGYMGIVDNYQECLCPSDYVECAAPFEGVGTPCNDEESGITKYKSCRCPAQYMDCLNGPETGASSCSEGGITKYDSCKAKCPNLCDYSSCPAGYLCEEEACSRRFCPIGCATDKPYIDVANYWCFGSMKCFFKEAATTSSNWSSSTLNDLQVLASDSKWVGKTSLADRYENATINNLSDWNSRVKSGSLSGL